MPISQKYRDLVSLFPQFLTVRRRKWTGLQDILQANGLERSQFFLLRAIVEETNPGEQLSRQEMEKQLFNPYATFNPIFDALPLLVEQGYLAQTDDNYLVMPQGRLLIEQTEQAARNYMATLTPIPLPEMTRLATLLEEVVQRIWQADEPAIKAHQARCHRQIPITTVAPMVHLEAAILALWMARDDAHIAAWRAKGLSGPQMDVLSHLASGEIQTVPALTAALEHTQHPEDVAQGVASLSHAGYVLVEGEHVTLTEAGQQVRDEIEEETDRVYFTPWPRLAEEELDEIYASLKRVCDLVRMDREPAPIHADYATLIAQGVVYVLADEKGIRGVLVMMPQGKGMFVENIAVDPRFQGQGLGRTLMAFVEQQARKKQLHEIHLYTNEVMTENLCFYEKLGFEEEGRRLEDGYHRVFLRKRLV